LATGNEVTYEYVL